MSGTRGPAFLEQLQAAVPGGVVDRNLDAIDPWIEVAPEHIASVCRWLKHSSPVAFDSIQCITAVDWFEPDAKKAAKVSWQPQPLD